MIQSKLFKNKLKWEFWPMWLSNIPVGFIWLFFSIRARNLFFFSTINPKFETGAMMGASKFNILKSLPNKYLPHSFLLSKDSDRFHSAVTYMENQNLSFPVILKPDVGERGLLVELIKNKYELKTYLEANNIDFIIQEFIDYPLEAGIFYTRLPNDEKGTISSIALKDHLKIRGDGISTIKELLEQNIHGLLQIERLKSNFFSDLNIIPEINEELIIEPIGNHCRGTKILNGNHLISDQLISLFDNINKQSEEVYYGRYDIRYKSWEDLLQGKNFKIIELNGAASEPMHIYDSSVPVIEKYRTFYRGWKIIFQISKVQRMKGVQPMTYKEGFTLVRKYFKYINSINKEWRKNLPKDSKLI